MALTRIKTNQITDLAVTTGKIANNAITAGKLANNLTYGSDLTVSGNLTVGGTTTAVQTTNTRVDDAIITLAQGTSGAPTADSGLLIDRGASNNVAFLWDESADEFILADVAAEDGDTSGNVTISSYSALQIGELTATGATAGNIQIGVTGDNEIDTSSGNLTIDSAGGTTTIDDNVSISGTLNVTNGLTTNVTDTHVMFSNSGVIAGSASLTWDGTDLTAGSAAISDLTSGRVVLAGTSGALEDSGNLTFNGSTLAVTGAVTVSSTLNVTSTSTLGVINASGLASLDGGIDVDGAFTVADTSGNVVTTGTLSSGAATLSSAKVSDLTDNRIVFAGASGELEDSADLTFDGTTFEVGGGYGSTGVDITMAGNISTNGTLTVDGTSTLAAIDASGLASLDGGIDVDGVFTVADTTGNVATTGTLASGNATVTGTLDVSALASLDGGIDVDGAFTVADTTGNVSTTGTLDAGETTVSSATVSDLTNNRVVIAGTAGAIEDDANLTMDGTTFKVGGGYGATGFSVAMDGNTSTNGTLTVDGLSSLDGGIDVNGANFSVATTGAVDTASTLTVDGLASLDGGIDVDGVFTVADTTGNVATTGTLASGNATITGTLDASGLASLDGGIDVDGAFTVADTTGNIATSGTLNVTGTSTLGVINASGLASLDAGIDVDGAFTVADTTGNVATTGTLTAGGLATLNGGIQVDGTAFTVADTSGNIHTDGTLDVDGATTLNGAVTLGDASGDAITVTGTATFAQSADFDGGITVAGSQTIDAGGNQIDNVADPTAAQDAATKAYVDSSVSDASQLTISDGSVTDVVTVGTDTFTFAGTANEVTTAVTNNTLTIGLPDDVTVGGVLTVTGNLIVNGTTTTLSTTNSVVEDNLIELGTGTTGVPANDSGFIVERGDSNNALFIWDESADKFAFGTTTAGAESTGDITYTAAGITASTGDFSGAVGVDGNFDVASTMFTVAAASGNTVVAGTLDVAGLASLDGGIDVDGVFTVADTTGNVATTGTLASGNATITGTLDVSALASLDGGIDVDGAFTVANTSGNISTTGTLNAGASTLSSAQISDLTDNRIVIAGASGELEDDANLTFDGTTFEVGGGYGATGVDITMAGNISTNGTLVVDGQSTLASAAVSDLTNNRVVIAGTSGELEDDANFTFDGTDLTVGSFSVAQATGNVSAGTISAGNTDITGTLDVSGLSSLDGGIDVDGVFTVADTTGNVATTGTLASGNATITGTLDVSALASLDGGIDVDGAFTVADTTGNVATTGTLSSGAATLSSAQVSDLTNNRIVIAGASGELEDDANLTFDGTTFEVGGGYGATGVDIAMDGNISTNGTLTVDGTSTLGVINASGLASLDGGIDVDGAFTVADTTGNVATSGTLDVTGTSTLGVINASGLASLDAGIDVDGVFTVADTTGNVATTGTLASGNATITGTLDVSGLASLDGGIDVDGAFTVADTSGNVVTSGTLNAGETTVSSATVSDLTSGRVVLAGTAGAIEDSGNLTFNGSTLAVTGNVTASNGATITGAETTMSSATVSDLTSGRVVLAGTSGALEDSGNLTFDGSTLAVTGAITASSNVDIADAGSLRVGTGNDFTINHDGTDTTITNGTGILAIDGLATSSIRVNEAGADVDFVVEGDTNTALLTVDASADTVGIGGAPNANAVFHINDTGAFIIPVGSQAQRPGTPVTGMFRYSSTINGIEYYDNDSWTSISSEFTVATSQTFNGDNSTVAFTLSALAGSDSYSNAGVLVMLNGVVQEPTTVYGVTGTTLTFTTAPASGDLIEVRKFTTTTTVTGLFDADSDTGVQVEESSDEDVIRFDTGGVERAYINSSGLAVAGNITATGNITANGDITLGDADTDAVSFGADVTSNILPNASDTYNLGSSGKKWEDIYVDDVIAATGNFSSTLDVTGTSTLGVINASGLASLDAGIDVDGAFTVANTTGNISTTGTLNVDGATTLNGDVTLGNATGDTITITGSLGSHIIPDTDSDGTTGYDLGSSSFKWRDLYLSGSTIHLGDLQLKDNGDNTLGVFQSDGVTEATMSISSEDAAKWTTARTITLGGDLSGSVSIDGSANVTLTATVAADSIALGTDTTGNYVATIADAGNSAITVVNGSAEGGAVTLDIVEERIQDIVGAMVTSNTESGITVTYQDADGTLDFDVNDPTITLSGDVTGSATMTNLGNVTITTTVAANSVALGTDTTGNYVAAGATSGNGISGSVSSEGGTFTVTSNATSANTGSTIVFRDANGDFVAGDVTVTDLVVGGNLTVSGTTVTNNATNLVVDDALIELNHSLTGANASDLGLILERGTTGDNAFIGWDESADKFIVGTTTATGASSGDLTITSGTLVASTFEGALSGNATTASAWQTARTLSLTGAVTGSASVDGSGNVSITTTATSDPTITLAGDLSGSATLTNLGNATLTATLTKDPVITLTGDVTGSGTMTNLGDVSFATTIAANSVALGTDTTGNYVATVAGGTGISVSGSGTESAAVTVTNSDRGSSQAIFKNVAVSGQSTVVADSNNDTLTLAAGTNISITTNATTDTITINANDTSVDWSEIQNKPDPTITLTGDVTGSGTMTDVGSVSFATTIAANSVALGTDTTGNYVGAGATSGNGISGSVSSEGGTFTVTSNATNANTASTIVYRDASGNFSAGTITASLSGNATTSSSTTGNAATATTLQTTRTINGVNFNGSANITVEPYIENDDGTNATRYVVFTDNSTASYKRLNEDANLSYNPSSNTLSTGIFSGTATAARYADLAEKYASDEDIDAGTVVMFVGDAKVGACNEDACRAVAGIVSTDPAYLMNSEQDGVALALAGRVPCKVTGVVKPGDLMVSAGNGMARAEADPKMGTVIGKAIEANEGGEGVIEVLAMMM